MEDVYEMSERVLLMDHGRIVYDGETVGFFDDKELLDRYGIETPDGFKMWQNL